MAKVIKHTPDRKGMRVVAESAPVKKKGDREELSLPTEKTDPLTRFEDYSTLMFGEKKIGKSSLLAQFPNAFFLWAEPGGKALRTYGRTITSWSQAKGYLKLLKSDKKFSPIITDTVDMLYTICFNDTCKKMGIDHPSDETYGKGWAEIRREFLSFVVPLMSIGKGVVFVSHATEKEVKVRHGQNYDRIQPTLANQGRDIIEGMVDIWVYYTYQNDRRVLIVRGNEHIAAGHRLQHQFKTPDGKDVPLIEMGTSAEESYKNFMDCFNNTYVPPKEKVTGPVKIKKRKAG